jgi:hypothetical protein
VFHSRLSDPASASPEALDPPLTSEQRPAKPPGALGGASSGGGSHLSQQAKHAVSGGGRGDLLEPMAPEEGVRLGEGRRAFRRRRHSASDAPGGRREGEARGPSAVASTVPVAKAWQRSSARVRRTAARTARRRARLEERSYTCDGGARRGPMSQSVWRARASVERDPGCVDVDGAGVGSGLRAVPASPEGWPGGRGPVECEWASDAVPAVDRVWVSGVGAGTRLLLTVRPRCVLFSRPPVIERPEARPDGQEPSTQLETLGRPYEQRHPSANPASPTPFPPEHAALSL